MSKRGQDIVALLAQADLLLLLGRLFSPPTAEPRAEIEAAWPGFAELVRQAGVGHEETLNEAFVAARREARGLDTGAWAGEYNRLFECAVSCPINESGFVRRDKGAILGDIAGFYRAFGLTLAGDATERVDHLVCELEFFAMLLVMLAKAREEKNKDGAEVSEKALSAFADDHLGVWLPTFSDRLMLTTGLPFYLQAAVLLREAWQGIVEYHGLPCPTEAAGARVGADPGTPYECGLAEAGLT